MKNKRERERKCKKWRGRKKTRRR